jgi:hypothetical protein
MLAFLIGTSIFNVFLGYALAVYLMRDSLALENQRRQQRSPQPNGVATSDRNERNEAPPATAADGSFDQTTPAEQQPASTLAEPAAASAENNGRADADRGEASEGADDLDQQLLAGIADFRSQLAKLRSETGDEEPKRRPVARTKP